MMSIGIDFDGPTLRLERQKTSHIENIVWITLWSLYMIASCKIHMPDFIDSYELTMVSYVVIYVVVAITIVSF